MRHGRTRLSDAAQASESRYRFAFFRQRARLRRGDGIAVPVHSIGRASSRNSDIKCCSSPRSTSSLIDAERSNDRNDAAAIAEAASRPNVRPVPIKTVDQLDIQTLHRVRERPIRHRTAIVSEIRGLPLEYGIVCAKGVTRFLVRLREEFAARIAALSPLAQEIFHALRDEFRALEERLASVNKRIKAVYDAHPVCRRLATIPGIGSLLATAIIASVSEPQRFKNGRQFAAYLGLVPRQHSTGGKPKLPGKSLAGNRYLRMLLVHGARSIIYHHRAKTDARSRWLQKPVERRGFHKANVAPANKNARVVWKPLTTPGEEFTLPLAA